MLRIMWVKERFNRMRSMNGKGGFYNNFFCIFNENWNGSNYFEVRGKFLSNRV